MKRIFEYKITAEFDGGNIKTILKKHYKMSSSLIKRLKAAEDGIQINGVRQKVDYIVTPGEVLKLTLSETASENIEPIQTDFEIVYEDEDVMIINKPAGTATHPSQGHHGNTLANGLMYYFKQKGEERVFRAVNRLDKDTSGLMCIAKNSYAHARLCEELHREFERRYMAIAVGQINEDMIIDAPIGRAEDSVIKRCVSEHGHPATTICRVLKQYRDYTLIELDLKTGRTHQIRVHMAHIGRPLLGDWLYGTEDKELFKRVALHSSYIRLKHPVSGEVLEFNLPLPEDMESFLKE